MGKPVIGLLGGPGSGKSRVAAALAERGAGVIDADRLSREALQTREVREQLVAWWGEDVLDATGDVDRGAVGRRVFEDAEALKALEGLLHPRVRARRAELRRQYAEDDRVKAIVEDSPLLLESGLGDACDVLIFVEAPRQARLARLEATRGWDEPELARREKNQWPLDTKRAYADYVVSNDATEADCEDAAARVFSRILHERVQ